MAQGGGRGRVGGDIGRGRWQSMVPFCGSSSANLGAREDTHPNSVGGDCPTIKRKQELLQHQTD